MEPLALPDLAHRTAELLRTHVPLTLLIDLSEEDGPHSAEHYAEEGGDAAWLPARS